MGLCFKNMFLNFNKKRYFILKSIYLLMLVITALCSLSILLNESDLKNKIGMVIEELNTDEVGVVITQK